MRALAYLGGGLLTGVGKGMVADGQAKREAAMEELRHQRQLDRDRDQRDFTTQRDERQHERQSERDLLQHGRTMERDESQHRRGLGLLHGTVTDESGGVHGVTRGGQAIDLGVTARQKGEDEFSPADKRLIDMIEKRYQGTGGRVDHDAVQQHLVSLGRRDLAQVYAGGEIGDSGMTYQQARSQAEREAEQRKSMWRSRSREFPETGGDPDAWVDRRTEELMQGRSPGADAATPRTAPSDARDDQQEAGQPSGQGTRDDPYRATTQAQIDWFKRQAPSGSVIEVDGRLYSK